jgi:hypothetical protein
MQNQRLSKTLNPIFNSKDFESPPPPRLPDAGKVGAPNHITEYRITSNYIAGTVRRQTNSVHITSHKFKAHKIVL